MFRNASNSLSSDQVLAGASSFQKKSEMPKGGSCLPFAIATIVLVGGILFLLPSHRVLPQSANLLSKMGIWGKIAGWSFIALGGSTFLLSLRKPKKQEIEKETFANATNNNDIADFSNVASSFSKDPVFPIAKQMVTSYHRAIHKTTDMSDQEIWVYYQDAFEKLKKICESEILKISLKNLGELLETEEAYLYIDIKCEHITDTAQVMNNFDQEIKDKDEQKVVSHLLGGSKENLVTALEEYKVEAIMCLQNYFNMKDRKILNSLIPGQMPSRIKMDFRLQAQPLFSGRSVGFVQLTIGWWGDVKRIKSVSDGENAMDSSAISNAIPQLENFNSDDESE